MDIVRSHANLELIQEPEYLNICFRFLGPETMPLEQQNALNLAIREQILQEGSHMVNYVWVRGGQVLAFRYVCTNFALTVADMESFVNAVIEVGTKIVKN